MADETLTSTRRGPSPLIPVAIVLSLAAGYAAGKLTSPSAADVARSYGQGHDDAEQKLVAAGILPPEPAALMSLSGAVLEVKDASFTMKVNDLSLNPLIKGLPATREVVVTAATEITGNVEVDPALYDKELSDYQAATKGFTPGPEKTPPVAPLRYETKKIALKDLKNGALVTVTADGDIKLSEKFTAKTVFSQGVGDLNLKARPADAPDVGPAGSGPHGDGAPPQH